jgi:predicted esterase
MQELSLEFPFKARYYQAGDINESTTQVWFVLHGYGQLARYFIKKFEILPPHHLCIIAPEGLSRFYVEPVEKRAITGNNRVGATWMTAENRHVDIENYLRYLNAVHRSVMTTKAKTLPVTILGFSQGAATATRWAIHNEVRYERLILWSGIFPPDMDFERAHTILATKTVALVYGKNDPYINDARLAEMTSLSDKLNLHPPIFTFEGGHEIDEKTLLNFT